MSFYSLPRPWNPGYAIPGYVEAEPPGRGTFTTSQLRRRTISQLIPDYLLERNKGSKMALAKISAKQVAMAGLGATDLEIAPSRKPGYPGDPIAGYGREMAAFILKAANKLPPDDRTPALREALDKIDPSLWESVAQKAEALEKRGMASGKALKMALAASMSDGFARELIQIGISGRMTSSGQVGISAFGCAPTDLGGFWSKTGDFFKSVGNKLQTVGCRVLTSPATPMAAGIAGQAAGVPAPIGASGAQLAGAACPRGSAPVTAPQGGNYQQTQPQVIMMPSQGGGISPTVIALGAAGILAAVLLTRRSQ